MIQHRPFSKLPAADRGWIKARFHFVPPKESFGPLIAWNDDEVAPHSGFPEHPHDNVEIVTFVREGAITHQDTLGNKNRATAGEVQVMSAGSGLRHSEVNADDEPVRLFQIWLATRSHGGAPRWGTSSLPMNATGGFVALASGWPSDTGAAQIDTNARVLAARLPEGETIIQPIASGRAYLVPTTGTINVNGVAIGPRDGCLVEGETVIKISVEDATEVVLVELI